MGSETGKELTALVEAIIGNRVTPEGVLESVSLASLAEVRQRIQSLPPNADFTQWLNWFFADRHTRAISPRSYVSVIDYIRFRATDTDPAARREALMLCPTDELARSHFLRSQTK